MTQPWRIHGQNGGRRGPDSARRPVRHLQKPEAGPACRSRMWQNLRELLRFFWDTPNYVGALMANAFALKLNAPIEESLAQPHADHRHEMVRREGAESGATGSLTVEHVAGRLTRTRAGNSGSRRRLDRRVNHIRKSQRIKRRPGMGVVEWEQCPGGIIRLRFPGRRYKR